MKKTYFTVSCLIILLISACETPKSPNFKLDHQVEAPLSVKKTYTFLGAEGALIDTTKGDYGDIFEYAEDGLVRVVKVHEFNFGNLNNAIPEVDVSPTTVNTQVGELELTSFNSSSSNIGSAGFQDITGFSSPSQGQTIPGGSGSVNIGFDTEFFKSAVIKEDGNLELTLTNNLGFHIDELEIILNSGSTSVGQTTIGTAGNNSDNFDHGSQRSTTILIPASTTLENLNVDITVQWNEQEMEAEGDNLIINNVVGKSLVASEFSGAPESQMFQNNGNSAVDESSFEFQSVNDFVALGSGELSIDISNQIDLGVTSLDIVFSDIVDQDGNPLTLALSNIPSSSEGGAYSSSVDLTNYRIKAEGGVIDYTIDAVTENVQDGFDSSTDSYRTIYETSKLDAEVNLSNLTISRADGYVVPKQILLNEDATVDGVDNIDVFNDEEAKITNLDGIREVSNRISNLKFTNPVLSTIYETNLGINTTIYAVIAGTKSGEEPVYLTGKDGTEYDVQSLSEIPDELYINGRKAQPNEVIKFDVDTAETPLASQGEDGSNIFTSSNTNSSEFFSNLPTGIRFIGVAEVNEKKRSGIIVNPVIFKPKFSVEIPFNFSADKVIFRDTVDADLGSLPGDGENQQLSSATLSINYENGLPLGIDLTLNLMDKSGNVIMEKGGISAGSADINSNGFVEEGGININTIEVGFTKSELDNIRNTRSIELYAVINSPQNKAVKIRKDDTVTFGISMKVQLTSTVN